MLKPSHRIVFICLCAMLISSSAGAIDYTLFSNQELIELQQAVRNAPSEEQEAYHKELESRLQDMSEEERNNFIEKIGEKDKNADTADEERKAPLVQGKGYEKGAGIVIFGGAPAGKGR
jgi:hypothetical protein